MQLRKICPINSALSLWNRCQDFLKWATQNCTSHSDEFWEVPMVLRYLSCPLRRFGNLLLRIVFCATLIYGCVYIRVTWEKRHNGWEWCAIATTVHNSGNVLCIHIIHVKQCVCVHNMVVHGAQNERQTVAIPGRQSYHKAQRAQ